MAFENKFQIWLHPVHGNSMPVPIAREDLALASSMEDRLSILAEVAAASTLQLSAFPPEAFRVELSLEGSQLRSRDLAASGARCILPVMFSQLGFSVQTSLNASQNSTRRAGVLALGLPQVTDQIEATSVECRPCNMWLLVITCALDRLASMGIDTRQAADVAMRDAVTTLVRYSAICDSLCGAQFSDAAWTRAPLGEGSSAEVKLMPIRFRVQGAELSDEFPYAIKLWSGKYASQDSRVFNEMRHFIQVQGHPNIGKFVGLFRTRVLASTPRWMMIMEAYQFGDLQEVVRTRGALPEVDAMTSAIGILRALVHVHSLDVIHRDVKLENVLLKQDGDVALVDFGIAVHVSNKDERMRAVGSPGNFAPEVLLGLGCVKKSDVFGCGTALYSLLGGVSPFMRIDHDSTMRANARAHVAFPENNFRSVNDNIKDLVRGMLRRSPRERLSSRDALQELIQEKQRLHIPPPGGLDIAPFDVVDPVYLSIASSSNAARAASVAQNEMLVPGDDQRSSSLGDEDTDMQSLTLHNDIEGKEQVEMSLVSTKKSYASRLASISSKAFTWVKRRVRLPRRDQCGHVAWSCDQTRTQATRGTESDSQPKDWVSVLCGSGNETFPGTS